MQAPQTPTANALDVQLNPEIDWAGAGQTFKRDGVVRVENLFASETAEALLDVLKTQTPWKLVHNATGDGSVARIPIDDIKNESEADRDQRRRAIEDQAARGEFTFVYYSFQIVDEYITGGYPGHPLYSVVDFLNTPDMHARARALISYPLLTKIDAQATLYRPDHFLTKHNDENDENDRRAAFVISLSKDWSKADGGNLVFLDENDRPVREITPVFNSITVFRVPQAHEVDRVAKSAPKGRYAITGWFRDDPVQPY